MLEKRGNSRLDVKASHRHDQIALALGSEIISGVRPPGSRMPSPIEFHKRFGASRVLMREVNKTLTAKGMLTAKTRVGTKVTTPEHWSWLDPEFLRWRVEVGVDAKFLLHLSEIRLAVEPAGASLAAERSSPQESAAIIEAARQMEQAGQDRSAYVAADVRFHQLVAAASGNPLHQSFAQIVEVALHALFAASAPADQKKLAENITAHELIAAAIANRDTEAASSATRQAINQGMRALASSETSVGV